MSGRNDSDFFTSAKNCVVSFCQRLCCSTEDSSDDETTHSGERARLIPEGDNLIHDGSQESLQNQDVGYQRSNAASKSGCGSVPRPKNDDQAALTEILTTMANNVMDVANVNRLINQTVETADYQERSYQYGKRLNKEATNLIARHQAFLNPNLLSGDDGLADVPQGEVGTDQGLADTDAMLIDEVASRAKDSVGPRDFQFKDVDRVLARFQPRNPDEDMDEDGGGDKFRLNGDVHA